jgi:hypothetical protein
MERNALIIEKSTNLGEVMKITGKGDAAGAP